MTANEFYLQAILHLASNPNYVEVSKSEDDPEVETHVLLTEELLMDAERLLNKVTNENGEGVFEEECEENVCTKEILHDYLGEISDKLTDISESIDNK